MPNNDYILRSDAVSAFCGNCEVPDICRMLGKPCKEVKQIKAIPAADVEPKQRWIPVTERLPEYPGRFMCVYEDEEYGEVGYCIDWGRYDPDDGWYVSGVTHWMPIPDLPENEMED